MWRITYETLMKKEPDPRGFEDAESLWGCKSLVDEVENMCAIDISAVQNACDIYCFLGDCFSSSMGSGRVLSNVIGCGSDMHRPALAFPLQVAAGRAPRRGSVVLDHAGLHSAPRTALPTGTSANTSPRPLPLRAAASAAATAVSCLAVIRGARLGARTK